MDVEALVAPVIEAAGLELWEVSFRREGGRRVLRVTVDREGGVDLDTISEVSERVSRRLDLEYAVRGSYQLEVSSPGIERSLRTPQQFRRSVGERVRVKTRGTVPGGKVHEGELVSADAGEIVLATVDGELRFAYTDVASARTVFDWEREKKRSRK